MSLEQQPAHHRVLASLDAVAAALDDADAAEVALWSLSTAEVGAAASRVPALSARLAELGARLLHHAAAEQVPATSAAPSPAAWLAATTRTTLREARAQVHLAAALHEHEPTRAAMAAGAVLPDQARVICEALDALPAEIDQVSRRRAERHLIDQAAEHDAFVLRRLGRHLLEVLDPEGAEAHEGRLLEAEERRARAKTRFTLRDNADGTWTGRFCIPDLHAALLGKAIDALADPTRPSQPDASQPGGCDGVGPEPEPEPGGAPGRRGRAFCELLEHLPVDQLPGQRRNGITLVVTITLDALLGRLSAAALDTGARISAAEARRLACEAGLIPMVLDGASMPLDLGREQRFHTRYQRLAMARRDGGCAVLGCHQPPARCHAHHVDPWATGGHTSVLRGWLLCGHHHRRAHDPTYTIIRHGLTISFKRRE